MDQTRKTERTKRALSTVALATLWLAGAGGGFAADAPMATNKPAATADGTVVIDNTTLWRHYHVAGPSRIRLPDGKLEVAQIPWAENYGERRPGGASAPSDYVPPLGKIELGGIAQSEGGMKDALWSALPPADWTSPGFDDSGWPRLLWPQPTPATDNYSRGAPVGGRFVYDTVLVLARTAFSVKDPAKVKSCQMSLDYWGGVVVYLNGKEVTRGHMAPGAVSPTDTAEDYPPEAFPMAEGKEQHALQKGRLYVVPANEVGQVRDRRLRVEIPVSLLRPGANVLAVEAHVSPITATGRELLHKFSWLAFNFVWPPIGLLNARLTMSEAGAGVTDNRSRPPGMQVWNCVADQTVTAFDYGSPIEPLRPITIRAGRNSVFSGRLVVSSDDQPIKGLQAKVTELAQAQGKARIPASAVRVRYAVPATPDKSWAPPHRFDGLIDAIPAEIPMGVAPKADSRPEAFWHYSAEPKKMVPGAVAPLWFTVRVPRDAAPGLYEGTVTVSAEGLPATTVPLRVQVSAWTAPEPRDFRVQNFLYSAEEVIPKYYGVPVWSDRHFELFGKVLALLAEVNSRQVQANLVTHYQGTFGGGSNPESLVRWIKQPDGSYKHDFTNFDKYLDMIAKSMGRPNTLRLNCWAAGAVGDGIKEDELSSVTVFDPAAGQLSKVKEPPWGTETSYSFWKPVMDEALKKIKARGWLADTTFGYTATYGDPAAPLVDLALRLWPEGEWSHTGHSGAEGMRFKGSTTNAVMPVRHADAVFAVPTGKLPPLWALDGPRRNTFTYTPRHNTCDGALLADCRQLFERLAVARGYDGLGEFGGNLFPLKSPSGGYYNTAAGRGTKWLSATVLKSLLYPGPDGPVATERFEMFREGLELCEAMLYVQQALAAKQLSADLEQRASRYLYPAKVGEPVGERTLALRRGWFSSWMMSAVEDAKLLDLAGEVERELERQK